MKAIRSEESFIGTMIRNKQHGAAKLRSRESLWLPMTAGSNSTIMRGRGKGPKMQNPDEKA
jgi:hypothetical protein